LLTLLLSVIFAVVMSTSRTAVVTISKSTALHSSEVSTTSVVVC